MDECSGVYSIFCHLKYIGMADLSLILGKNLKTLTEDFHQPLVSVIMPCYKMGAGTGAVTSGAF